MRDKKNIVGPGMSLHKAHELVLKLEKAGLFPELVQEIIQSKNNELAIKMVRMIEEYYVSPAPELEENDFSVDSNDWEVISVEVINAGGVRCKISPQGDIWEFLEGKYAGRQLFTWDAAIRETKKAGKQMPSDAEFSRFLKTRGNMPNVVFAGNYHYNGFFEKQGERAVFWSRSKLGDDSAYIRWLDSSSLEVAACPYEARLGFSVRCLKSSEESQAEQQKTIKPGDKVVIGIRDIVIAGQIVAREVARGIVKGIRSFPDDLKGIGEITLCDDRTFIVTAKTVIEKIS